jgi:hypothetical protein
MEANFGCDPDRTIIFWCYLFVLRQIVTCIRATPRSASSQSVGPHGRELYSEPVSRTISFCVALEIVTCIQATPSVRFVETCRDAVRAFMTLLVDINTSAHTLERITYRAG